MKTVKNLIVNLAIGAPIVAALIFAVSFVTWRQLGLAAVVLVILAITMLSGYLTRVAWSYWMSAKRKNENKRKAGEEE